MPGHGRDGVMRLRRCRRLAIAVPMLAAVSIISYLLLYRAADPVARLRQIPTVRGEDLRRLIHQQGLDAPWYEGYWKWLTGFVHGDWGVSATNKGVDAIEPIRAAIPATLELMLLALVVSAILAAALGVLSAVRPYSATDLTITGFAYLAFATPTFVAGVLLQLGAIWMRDNGWAVAALRPRHGPGPLRARPAEAPRGRHRGPARRGRGADRVLGGPLGPARRRRPGGALHEPAVLVRPRGPVLLGQPPPAPGAAGPHAGPGERGRLEPVRAGGDDRGARAPSTCTPPAPAGSPSGAC